MLWDSMQKISSTEITDWLFDKRVHSKKSDFEPADDLRVIGAGLPCTGTLSLKTALEILGFGPCHNMLHIFDDPSRCVQFIRAFEGEQIDFRQLMKDYGSTVDSPCAEFYKEIHQAYPNAKIILTVRDSADKWFQSLNNTIGVIGESLLYLIAVCPILSLRLQCLLARRVDRRWAQMYGSYGPQVHDRHNAQVIKENKKEDVLVFNVKEGWAPLCKFLNVPIPTDIPFPNVNDTEYVQHMTRRARFMGLAVWTFIFLISGIIIRMLI